MTLKSAFAPLKSCVNNAEEVAGKEEERSEESDWDTTGAPLEGLSSFVVSHVHRSIDSGKVKDTRPAFPQEQNSNIYQGSNQPSTSKAVKKVPPHIVQVDGSSEKLGKKKKLAVPKIIVTGPSDEVLMSNLSDELPETKTIRDTEEYGPFTVHSKPSTVDAYRNHRE